MSSLLFCSIAVAIAGFARSQIKMEVILVMNVTARTKDRFEILATVTPNRLQQAFLTERKQARLFHRNCLSIVERDLPNVDRITARVFGHRRTTLRIHGSA